jgi:hypothetical protein
MTTRRDEFVSTILDADLLAIRARHEARLGGELARIAAALVAVSRAVAQAREAV